MCSCERWPSNKRGLNMIANRTVEHLAAGIVSTFPALDVSEQRFSLQLYRLLATGQPVARADLAEGLRVSVEIVDPS